MTQESDGMNIAVPVSASANSPDHRVIYCNATNLTGTVWDISLEFGRLEVIQDGNLTSSRVVKQTTIIMSPQHAKSLANIITNAVANYEKQYGTLNIDGTAKS